MTKVNEKVKLFFQAHPCGKVFTHDQQTRKPNSKIFVDSFCPVPWQTTLSLHRCQATFSSCHSKPDLSKMNFPSCCQGSSKDGNGVLLCRGLRLREWTTVWQSVWVCGRIKHASHSLYSLPNHQRQLCALADKKEVKLLKKRTSRLGVESAICWVEVKRDATFFSAALLWNPIVCHC